MNKYIYSLLFCIIGCISPKDYYIQQDIKPYVNEFYKDAAIYGRILQKDNLIVISGNLGAPLGITEVKSGQRIVTINQNVLDKMPKLVKKIVVYHELGHALLMRPHVDSIRSIMNSSACINCEIDSYYLQELFK